MSTLSCEDFITAAEEFLKISDKTKDGWKMYRNQVDQHKSYLKKETFLESKLSDGCTLLKTEYILFYNQSYGVPSFSFNIWDSSGVLLSLEKIRQMSFLNIHEKDFYSVITQHEHPIFFQPYFMMHPCHTSEILSAFKDRSKNIIVTFLGLITPLIKLKMPLEYGFGGLRQFGNSGFGGNRLDVCITRAGVATEVIRISGSKKRMSLKYQ